jgi:hypothetical protein
MQRRKENLNWKRDKINGAPGTVPASFEIFYSHAETVLGAPAVKIN